MKTSKKLYSEHFSEYQLDQKQTQKVQNALLEMFLDFKAVCDEYHIDYMLCGGSLLGAIRHKGFIPWDDDMDIMMLRSEYERFKSVIDSYFTEKYILAEPLKDKNYFFKMPKIYKKGTTYVEIANAGFNTFDMLFIDIFIIEAVPTVKSFRKLSAICYDFAYKASSLCLDYQSPSPIIEEAAKQSSDLARYYSLRKKLGCVFYHLGGVSFYLSICDKIAQIKKFTDSSFLAIPSGIAYERELFPREVLTTVTTTSFCGYDVKIPKHYDSYLSNLYGDYMQMPREEDREYHMAYKVVV